MAATTSSSFRQWAKGRRCHPSQLYQPNLTPASQTPASDQARTVRLFESACISVADDGALDTPCSLTQPLELPPLPRNVRVEYHPNGCYDWGTIGWLLDSGKVDVRPYKYFIFMNSSVRGPYLPVFTKVKPRVLQCLYACPVYLRAVRLYTCDQILCMTAFHWFPH